MTTLIRVASMAKGKVGRPAAADGGRGTRQIRVFADIADMIADILEVETDDKLTTATLLDPLIRASITARHQRVKPIIDELRKHAAQRERIIADFKAGKK